MWFLETSLYYIICVHSCIGYLLLHSRSLGYILLLHRLKVWLTIVENFYVIWSLVESWLIHNYTTSYYFCIYREWVFFSCYQYYSLTGLFQYHLKYTWNMTVKYLKTLPNEIYQIVFSANMPTTHLPVWYS